MISILLVDDNPHDRRLARRAISKALPGASFLEAFNPDQVTDAVQSKSIDLVVTDYQLRWSTGLHVLQEAKTTLGPDIPVIMFTNTGTEEVAVEGMKNGLDDYVLKAPDRYKTLAESVVQVLRRQAEKNEQRRQEEARSRAKDDFLMMMAHELRGPLAPMRSALFLLRQDVQDEETRQFALEALGRQVEHMSQLVNDLLDVSRIISGRLRLQPEPLDLARLVEDVVQDRRIQFADAGIELGLSLSDEPCWILADRTRLLQILGNLLDNALKFTPSGESVHVQVELLTSDLARLTVRDTGIGVEPEVLERLFEPFVQADRSLGRTAGGLGMGLAVVKRLVELHGGTVQASSEGPGHGTMFTIILPRTQAPVTNEIPPTFLHKLSRSRRVLVIEDYPDTAQMMRLLLESQGYEVLVATTGEEGVRKAQDCAPDLVLCDLGLPGISGFEVARDLRDQEKTRGIHIIAISGYGQEQDRSRALDSGFDDHLTKPVSPEVLLARLSELWGEGEA